MDPIIFGNSRMGRNTTIQENVIIGTPSKDLMDINKKELPGAVIGSDSIIRSGSVIYSKVKIGDKFKTGHNILVREDTTIGNNVLIGTNSILENKCNVGNNVSIQSNVYIPTNTKIGSNVFIGPNACLTNDKYPTRIKDDLVGPILKDGVTVGANATILPGLVIGEGSIVAAGAVVTKNVGAWKIAMGVPAREIDMPRKLKTLNKI
jgi:acetyltransferase-like isoleucine patch superfamily enzyme